MSCDLPEPRGFVEEDGFGMVGLMEGKDWL